MDDSDPKAESTFWEHQSDASRTLYRQAQEAGKLLGREFLLPSSLLLAFVQHSGLLDGLLDTSGTSRDALVSDVAAVVRDDQVTLDEILYAKTILSQAAALAVGRGSDLVSPSDILRALLRARPPSLVGLFAGYGLSLDEVDGTVASGDR